MSALQEVLQAAVVFAGAVSTGAIIFVASIVLAAPKGVWRRNHAAIVLAKKKNRGKQLATAEEAALKGYVASGVLVHRGLIFKRREGLYESPLTLSYSALRDVLQG